VCCTDYPRKGATALTSKKVKRSFLGKLESISVKRTKYPPEPAEDNIPLAFSYRMLGTSFQLSAKTLLPTLETRADGTPVKYTAVPFLYLVSHAAELYLKAALLKRGYGESDLRKFDLRHDLSRLLRALQATGVSVSPETARLIEGLSSQHSAHTLRYTIFLERQRAFMPPLATTSICSTS
jgi:hypothetical protein